MALESATYINGLNVSNPASSDLMAQADDHIRMLKAVLKNTFPNITGAVTQTQNMLNNAVVPVGGIIMWSGSPASLPSGWKLCDGGTYAKSDGSGNITVPDLRDKFIRGCGGSTGAPTASPTVGTTGGQDSVTPTITVNNQAVALTQAQLPNYNLTVTDPGHGHTVNDPGHSHNYEAYSRTNGPYGNSTLPQSLTTKATDSATTGITIANNTTGITVSSGGSGQTHVHDNTATSSAVSTVPPYYTLAFIIKI